MESFFIGIKELVVIFKDSIYKYRWVIALSLMTSLLILKLYYPILIDTDEKRFLYTTSFSITSIVFFLINLKMTINFIKNFLFIKKRLEYLDEIESLIIFKLFLQPMLINNFPYEKQSLLKRNIVIKTDDFYDISKFVKFWIWKNPEICNHIENKCYLFVRNSISTGISRSLDKNFRLDFFIYNDNNYELTYNSIFNGLYNSSGFKVEDLSIDNLLYIDQKVENFCDNINENDLVNSNLNNKDLYNDWFLNY